MSRDFKEPCAEKRAASARRVREYRARLALDPIKSEKRRREKWDYDRKYLYGVTMAQIAEHLAAQGGTCKICRTALSMDKLGQRKREGKPHVDHCHTTGAFRGILCTNCNIGIGMFRDNPLALSNAIKYLGDTQ